MYDSFDNTYQVIILILANINILKLLNNFTFLGNNRY
jgi:hypothetical protein